MFGRINAIGIEIEGIFKRPLKPRGTVLDFHSEWLWPDRAKLPDVYKTGIFSLDRGGQEVVSVPLKNWQQVGEFFDNIEPHWNEKSLAQGMGMHIHVSFVNKLDYAVCFSEEFAKHYIESVIAKFGDDPIFRDRLKWRSSQGTNFYKTEYPRDYFSCVKDLSSREERYYAVNFLPAYRSHNTFEFRLFPANTLTKMKEYVDWTVKFVNKYISSHRKSVEDKVYSVDVPIPKLPKSKITSSKLKPSSKIDLGKLPMSIDATPDMITVAGRSVVLTGSGEVIPASQCPVNEKIIATYELSGATIKKYKLYKW